MEAMLNVNGASPDAVAEVRKLVNDILSSANDQQTKQVALQVLPHLLKSKTDILHNSFVNNE